MKYALLTWFSKNLWNFMLFLMINLLDKSFRFLRPWYIIHIISVLINLQPHRSTVVWCPLNIGQTLIIRLPTWSEKVRFCWNQRQTKFMSIISTKKPLMRHTALIIDRRRVSNIITEEKLGEPYTAPKFSGTVFRCEGIESRRTSKVFQYSNAVILSL